MKTSDLLVPDRFDTLQRKAPSQLQGIIEPIEDAQKRIEELLQDMRAAGRGGFLILRGESGSGKSTFLNTLGLFMNGIEVVSIPRESSIAEFLKALRPTSADLRICVIEGRDALREVKSEELEAAIHDINSFIRRQEGEKTAVIWPVNSDDIRDAVIEIAQSVGADSLLGVGDPAFIFTGPDKSRFVEIANKTIAVLNNGAGLFDLGVSRNRAQEILSSTKTIGQFLGQVRKELLQNTKVVQELFRKERCRLWVVVVSGNEPEGEVDALTRGVFSFADIERLMDATQANIVSELKNHPEKLGILGTVLDARIFHMPILTALSIARNHHDQKLLTEMKDRGLSTAGNNDSTDRLKSSGLGKALNGDAMGLKNPGGKIGSNTESAFAKLVDIATNKDELVNAALGRALQSANLIGSFETEKNLGTGLTRFTDIYCLRDGQPIRIEMMWRSRTSRAEIANYVLTKLYNYGRAINFLAPVK